ncbi:MAG: PaaI family thioesterase [Anaerolineaceae bacterium]|nr:PaaI family thioesterase [Anaerolineaceae bacterium]
MRKLEASDCCFVCGRENPASLKMEFYEMEPGRVEARLSVPQVYGGYPGVVHGGIITAMLDETSGRAAQNGPENFMFTSEINVRFRKNVPTEQPLVVTGTFVRRRGSVAFAHGEIRDEAGELLAESNGVFVDIPKEKLEAIGHQNHEWKVYPDGH